MQNFKVARFEFTLSTLGDICLPAYKGSTLRGGFGHAFRKVTCIVKGKRCEECLLKGKCIYSYIFDTPPPEGATRLRKYPAVPHPFVIEPPQEDKENYGPGESLLFNLILVGRAIDYLPYFIYTFDELGRMGIGKGKGKFKLDEVKSISLGNVPSVSIYSGKEKMLFGTFQVITSLDFFPILDSLDGITKLSLEFITPTRLKYQGRLTGNLEFHVLFRNLLRRLSNLSYFHCGEELKVDFRSLITKAQEVKVENSNLRWQDWPRYSARQKTGLLMGGVMGEVTYTGELSPFLPYLLWGELCHVGKGTAFGLGKYRIKV